LGFLDQIHKGRRVRARRSLFYGIHGVGKSTLGANADGAIVIPFEDGIDDIDCESMPRPETFDQAIEALSELYSEHPYRTVVIDTLDALEVLIHKKVCDDRKVTSIEEINYGKGYLLALNYWRDFLAGLEGLREQKGMSIILIAHALIERFQNPETEGYDRYRPKLHKAAAGMIMEWCDDVLFATYKVYTKVTEESFGKTIVKAVGKSDDRVLRTTERPAHLAKNRLGMPEEIPLAWVEYAKYLPKPSDNGGKPNHG
jgi:AAA domain